VWTGGNEGHARKELYDVMRNSITELDGTRPFIPSSSGFAKLPTDWKGSWPDNMASGVYSGGPYSWKTPKEYYDLANNAKDWVFKDEIGVPSQPPFNILPKIIPNLVWDKTLPFPFNNSWGYHDAANDNGKYESYYQSMINSYGQPASIKEFSDKMQLMNAVSYQAIFESAGNKLNENGGVMLWKLNAAFPSVIWQVYDWYMQPNAGYYFMQNACEPTHIQFSQDNQNVTIVNRSYSPLKTLTVESNVYSAHSKLINQQTKVLNIKEESVTKVIPLSNILSKCKDVSFIVLRLKDEAGNIISRNTYWLSSDDNYKSISGMNKAQIKATVVSKDLKGSHCQWTLKLTNPSGQLAFFIRPMLMSDGEEVLPSLWSSNYITLKPGESIIITVNAPLRNMNPDNLSFQIEGWNINIVSLSLK